MFEVRYPKGPLSNWVECVWLYDACGLDRGQESALPTGTVEVVFDLSGEGMSLSEANQGEVFYRDAVVCGPHTKPFTLHNGPRDHVLGIHLKPAAASRFLSVAAKDLRNKHYGLDSICHGPLEELKLSVLEQSPGARLGFAEEFLSGSASLWAQPDSEVVFVAEALKTQSVADALDQVGYSERTMRERFVEQVGMSPKAFHRVMRFQNLLAQWEAVPSANLGELASQCGYYDQPHFIHDFRDFSGMTPGEYQRKRGEWVNHVSDL